MSGSLLPLNLSCLPPRIQESTAGTKRILCDDVSDFSNPAQLKTQNTLDNMLHHQQLVMLWVVVLANGPQSAPRLEAMFSELH